MKFKIARIDVQGAQNWSVNCYLESAMVHMASSCNGRQSCSISEQAFNLNQDSCPGTERYLEAHYKCRPDKGEKLLKVPAQILTLYCIRSSSMAGSN